MRCPVCPDATLVMTERQGVEIDYCPQCRGVWLDRGELDKIIERAAAPAAPADSAARSATVPGHPHHGHDHRDRGRHDDPRPHHYDSGHYGQRKKKSLLGDLFDFD